MQKSATQVKRAGVFGVHRRVQRAAQSAIRPAVCLLLLMFATQNLRAANPSAAPAASASPASGTLVLERALGIQFIPGSSSTVLIERDGKTYLVDLAGQTIQEQEAFPAGPQQAAPQLMADHASGAETPAGSKVFAENCAGCHGAAGKGSGMMKTPDFTNPAVQAALPEGSTIKTIRDGKPGTAMPAWQGKLSEAEINAVATFVKSLGQPASKPAGAAPGAGETKMARLYTPADDYVYSLPSGRPLDRHGLYLNFTHRFVYTPAFSGTGSGDTLFGLDNFSISSFGLRFGVTSKLSVSAYRSPSLINRPIELGVAYNFLDEHRGNPFNAAVRLSEDGQNDFDRNFTTNFELISSRSIRDRAQLYLVPTVSIAQRELTEKPGSLASAPPGLPGFNTFSLGVGGALNIRPTVALVSEVIPTLVNGPELGIHRPAFAFGIQKRVLRHVFTLGFSNSPGTIVSQRAGTRATFLDEPTADTPKGLFIGFDLMRQIY